MLENKNKYKKWSALKSTYHLLRTNKINVHEAVANSNNLLNNILKYGYRRRSLTARLIKK